MHLFVYTTFYDSEHDIIDHPDYIISSLPLQIPISSPLKAPATPNPPSILPSSLKISAHPSALLHRFPAIRKGSKSKTAET